MTALDIGVVGVIAVSALSGLMRGLVREAFALAAWVLAFVCAKLLAPLLAPLVPGVESEALRHLAALLALFVVILAGTSLVGMLLAGMIKLAGLGFYDRFLGLGFGVLRGVVIVVIFALLAGLTALPETEFWQASLTHGPLESAAKMVIPWVPESLATHLRF